MAVIEHHSALTSFVGDPANIKTLLHVGCGLKTRFDIKGFEGADWRELRLDINPAVKPDIVGSITDMSMVPAGSVDAVYSSHNIEHVFPHEASLVLAEFRRVLRDDGFVVLTCPNLQSVCQHIAEGRIDEPLYISPAGPISAIDALYGFRPAIANGHVYMAHRSGFTVKTLTRTFFDAGFPVCISGAQSSTHAIWALAFKQYRSKAEVSNQLLAYLP